MTNTSRGVVRVHVVDLAPDEAENHIEPFSGQQQYMLYLVCPDKGGLVSAMVIDAKVDVEAKDDKRMSAASDMHRA